MSNIVVNETEYCKLLVQYEADNDMVLSKKTEVLNKFKGQKVPGFRPGFATIDAIKQHYRKEINETLKQELAEEAINNVVSEKNIKPFGRPTFSSLTLEDSKIVSINGESAIPKFRCEFSIYKQPEFELAAYKEFDIPKPAGIMPVEELTQRMVQDLRTRFGQTIAYEENDFVQMNDSIILDYKTFEGETSVESLTSSGEILNVGRINIPGFSENLLGMKLNESREFNLNMPETYKPEFAGKELKFEVKLLMGSKIEPSPLNDELAKKVGIENFDMLMDNVRSTATSRVSELEKNHIWDQISRRLLELHNFEIPQWISTAEAQINARNAKQEWEAISDKDKEKYIDNAEKSIKLSLILQKVRDNEPLAQLTDEEVFNSARQNIAKYSEEPDKVIAEIYKNGHLPILFNRIKDEHTLNFVEKTCKFIE